MFDKLELCKPAETQKGPRDKSSLLWLISADERLLLREFLAEPSGAALAATSSVSSLAVFIESLYISKAVKRAVRQQST